MLRLDYILMRSVINEAGDKLEWEGGLWFVKSFANRDNNGTQPVPDDFPVIVEWDDGLKQFAKALCIFWDDGALSDSIKSWKPDINKLLEQQNEYDSQQEKPIEEIMINAKESKMSKFKEHQRVYVEGCENTRWLWGCLTLDGKNCILLSDGGHMVMSVSRVSATPFKTELEIAKEKQIENLERMYKSYLDSTREISDFFRMLQANGQLAEIILPLEG